MSNIHGLHSNKDSDSEEEGNNRYVGGIGERGGGSGLAVRPNPDDIFQQAQGATAEDSERVRRTITMYRDGFVVDDGPYRRLDDPNNAVFLRSLAAGRTPRELAAEGNVVIGLVDKRNQDYVEEFQSFSGAGASVGTARDASEHDSTVLDPAVLAATAPAADDTGPTTSIQVRLVNGQRMVVSIPLSATVAELAARIVQTATPTMTQAFRLVAGYPPKPLETSVNVEEAGLKGAQVSVQAV